MRSCNSCAFRTFKLWQRLSLFAWKTDWIQRRLDVYRDWHNTERPMWTLGSKTPEEVWSNLPLPQAFPMQQRDRLKPAVTVSRVHFHGDCHLPKLNIQIIRSTKRAA